MVCEESNEKLIKRLKDKINDGIYSIGEQVVPQVFRKLSMVNGEINIEEITIQGKFRTHVSTFLHNFNLHI